jgi:hypothetical protein
MTKDKFQDLCSSVLIPRVGDLLNQHLPDIHETLEAMLSELIRIERRLSALESALAKDDTSGFK